MIQQIDHIGIAVRSLETASKLYQEVLGMAYEGQDHVEEQGVKVAFFRCGEVMIELLEPTRPDSPVAKFIESRGEGVHHIALKTDDIGAQRQHAQRSGLRLLSDKPLDGAHGKLISFVHPKDTLGVLLEFTQRKPAHHHEG